MKPTDDTVDSSSVVTSDLQGVRILVRFGYVIVIAVLNERSWVLTFDRVECLNAVTVLREGSAGLAMLLLMLGQRPVSEGVQWCCDAGTRSWRVRCFFSGLNKKGV